MEGYFTNTSRFDRPKRSEHEIFHLTMLAETNEGYRNLIKVTSAAYLDGYYYKPRSDWELLERHHDGHHRDDRLPRRARLAADPEGRASRPRSKPRRASRTSSAATTSSSSCRTTASTTTRACSGRCSTSRASSARRCSPRTTATTRTRKTPRRTTRCCACRPARCKSDAKRFKFDGDDFYIKRRPRCATLFRELPDACDNTLLIAERADVEIEFGQAVLPVVPGARGPRRELVPARAHDGGRARSATAQTPAPHVLERIEYELDVIKSMGFSAYFLVVWDLVRYAKSRGIRVGPGRGSAAGSCVAYCLRIVDIDPIKYDLLFERILNPGRKQMPDIDMDFDSRYRGEMIRYAAQKYGARPRRAGHHVLHDQGAGRGARRARGCSATRTSSATRSPS